MNESLAEAKKMKEHIKLLKNSKATRVALGMAIKYEKAVTQARQEERERIVRGIEKDDKPLPKRTDRGYWTALTSKEVRHNVCQKLLKQIEGKEQ